jgi:hypothetical protein
MQQIVELVEKSKISLHLADQLTCCRWARFKPILLIEQILQSALRPKTYGERCDRLEQGS